MFRNIWEEEPLSEDELDLKYECKPGHDYFADVDQFMPPWTLPDARYLDTHPTAAAFSEQTLREVRVAETETVKEPGGEEIKGPDGKPKTRTRVVNRSIPFKRYVRAVDPAGNLCALITSTITPDRLHPNGDDGLPTQASVIAKKNGYGWLVLERRQDFWNPFSGKRDQDYCAWALAVMKYRKAKHASHEKKEGEAFLEDQTRKALEIANAAARTQGDIIAKAIRETNAPNRK